MLAASTAAPHLTAGANCCCSFLIFDRLHYEYDPHVHSKHYHLSLWLRLAAFCVSSISRNTTSSKIIEYYHRRQHLKDTPWHFLPVSRPRSESDCSAPCERWRRLVCSVWYPRTSFVLIRAQSEQGLRPYLKSLLIFEVWSSSATHYSFSTWTTLLSRSTTSLIDCEVAR